MLSVVLLLIISSILSVACDQVGKITYWSVGEGSTKKADYQTKSVHVNHASQYLEEIADEYNAIVLLKSQDSSSVLLAKDFGDAFMGSQTVMSSVYTSNDESISNYILSAHTFKEHKKVSIETLKKEFDEGTAPKDKRTTFEVAIDTTNTERNRELLETLKNAKAPILCIAIEESKSAVKMTSASPAHYSRILASTTSGDLYYEPEGTEFSIYYADTYLYITPDIFTGLMTGLFIFFVLLIGLSCLSDIQGMNNFVDKLPSVGKEN